MPEVDTIVSASSATAANPCHSATRVAEVDDATSDNFGICRTMVIEADSLTLGYIRQGSISFLSDRQSVQPIQKGTSKPCSSMDV